MTNRIPVVGYVQSFDRIVRAAVGRNDPEVFRLSPCPARCVEKDHLVGCLHDLGGWPHAWDAIRLALEERVLGIRISIQVLNLIPVFRLIDWPVRIESPSELAIYCLVRLIVTTHLIGRTSARRDIRGDIAPIFFCAPTIPAAAAAAPHPT